jgi:hypothetical protein
MEGDCNYTSSRRKRYHSTEQLCSQQQQQFRSENSESDRTFMNMNTTRNEHHHHQKSVYDSINLLSHPTMSIVRTQTNPIERSNGVDWWCVKETYNGCVSMFFEAVISCSNIRITSINVAKLKKIIVTDNDCMIMRTVSMSRSRVLTLPQVHISCLGPLHVKDFTCRLRVIIPDFVILSQNQLDELEHKIWLPLSIEIPTPPPPPPPDEHHHQILLIASQRLFQDNHSWRLSSMMVTPVFTNVAQQKELLNRKNTKELSGSLCSQQTLSQYENSSSSSWLYYSPCMFLVFRVNGVHEQKTVEQLSVQNTEQKEHKSEQKVQGRCDGDQVLLCLWSTQIIADLIRETHTTLSPVPSVIPPEQKTTDENVSVQKVVVEHKVLLL